MFAIMVPVLLLPAIGTLYGLQRKAVKAGMTDTRGATEHSEDNKARSKSMSKYSRMIWSGILEIDLAGLVLLGFAFSLILLPFSLAESAGHGWANRRMVAMEVFEFVILGFFNYLL